MGLFAITTNYGALFETCADFPVYVNYTKDYKKLSVRHTMKQSMCQLHKEHIQNHLNLQQAYMKYFYDWQKRKFNGLTFDWARGCQAKK